jgi:HEAT repeat protein
MAIIDQLASTLQRKDETPNIELAQQIAKANDKKAVEELIALLHHKSKDVQNDAIKVVYETGALNPSLISGHIAAFAALLQSRNNRMQWGAMTALQSITTEHPGAIYEILPQIIDAADKGSVITNDQCVAILIRLCAVKKYADDAFALLLERLKASPVNQLPMYAENALPVITSGNKTAFTDVLTMRLADIEKETKRARVEKVIKKAGAVQ